MTEHYKCLDGIKAEITKTEGKMKLVGYVVSNLQGSLDFLTALHEALVSELHELTDLADAMKKGDE